MEVCEARGFSEGRAVAFDKPPFESEVDDYDYDSDSDLSYFSDEEENILDAGIDNSSVNPEDGNEDSSYAEAKASASVISELCGKANDSLPGRTVKVITIKDTAYVM